MWRMRAQWRVRSGDHPLKILTQLYSSKRTLITSYTMKLSFCFCKQISFNTLNSNKIAGFQNICISRTTRAFSSSIKGQQTSSCPVTVRFEKNLLPDGSRTVPGPFRNLPTPVPKFHETWCMPAVCPITGGGLDLDADRSIWSDSSVGKCSLLGKFLQNTRIWSMMCRMISTEGEWQRVQAIRVSR